MDERTATNHDQEAARGRLRDVFRFLKHLQESRYPCKKALSEYDEVLRLSSWPSHPSIQIGRLLSDESVESTADDEPFEPAIFVRRATVTSCPKPPVSLDGWLKSGWESVEAFPQVIPARNVKDQHGQTVTVQFSELPNLAASFNEWVERRRKWAEAERPARAARTVFDRLYGLWTRLQRDGDKFELILADGMLRYSSCGIEHPILLQHLSLEFDPETPAFGLYAGTEQCELYSSVFLLIQDFQPQLTLSFQRQIESDGISPLGEHDTESFLRRLVQGLFQHGEYLDKPPSAELSTHPLLWREQLIFLRPRTLGLTRSLDQILNVLHQPESKIPDGLARIVGVERPPRLPADDTDMQGQFGRPSFSSEILFSKSANAEQYELASRLKRTRSVLVQGPPGTGKTHTIANLLGTLLAQGKSVLVTAHTTKALRVLREQIDKSLQPLCLSVLDSDAESHAQLSSAAQSIADRISSSDPASLRAAASESRRRRQYLLKQHDDITRHIRDARYSEIEEIVISGGSISPIHAAKLVREAQKADGWIPPPIAAEQQCPLNASEFVDLYRSNRLISAEDELFLQEANIVADRLLDPAGFKSLVAAMIAADHLAGAHAQKIWIDRGDVPPSSTDVKGIARELRDAAATLSDTQAWLREVLYAGWMGGHYRGAWDDLLSQIADTNDTAGKATRREQQLLLQLPQSISSGQAHSDLAEIVEHLKKGGRLGVVDRITKRAWFKTIDACRVRGHPPKDLEDFESLLLLASLSTKREQLRERWRRQVEAVGGPKVSSLGQLPERTAGAYVESISQNLGWRTRVWEPLVSKLRSSGLRWDDLLKRVPPVAGPMGELSRLHRALSAKLVAAVEARAAVLHKQELLSQLDEQRLYLSAIPSSRLAQSLLRAAETKNVEAYERTFSVVTRLQGLRPILDQRQELLERLRAVAPHWAAKIERRESPHDADTPPGDPTKAWEWAAIRSELERRSTLSIPDLQDRLAKLVTELQTNAAEIIESEAWAAQCERVGLTERQALLGYVQVIKKIGKGHGKIAAKLLPEARRLLARARTSVPVWIMPLSRVYESFEPSETRFNVVIIDEASQSDVTALAALFLGDEHVVVGDKDQVTPDAVGQEVDNVQTLIGQFLRDVPNSALYDGQTSIYDLAEQSFGGVVALKEHFRCVPEIIQFSNALSYNNAIRPLRDATSSPIRPGVVSHRVTGHRDAKGKTNTVEAEEIVSLICACIDHDIASRNEYGAPTSIGAISLLGDEQAFLIETLLRQKLPPDVYAKHRLLCGNAAQFQGDERDVVFLSLVDGPPDNGMLPLRDAGPRDIYKKRFNVAVSRARNQLWVVHSLDPMNHLKGGDLRRRLILHARDPQALMREINAGNIRVESEFERQVLERLVNEGFKVHAQWPVGAFRIDLVVEGDARKLAVECDGERWHTGEQLQKDMERQAILERLGWVFCRIRGSQYFRDPTKAMAPVFDKLRELGIERKGIAKQACTSEPTEIVAQLRHRAQEIRNSWVT